MRGWTRVLAWVAILLACAGIGAFVASRSNPFPPEVGVEGATPTTPTPPPEEPTRWRLTMTSRTSHAYRVGGACTSDWRMRSAIGVSPEGRVRGTGVARLQPGAGCDFETAQIQARRISVRMTGERIGAELTLRFRVVEVAPAGAQDLGGFVGTVPSMGFAIRERSGASVAGPTQVREDDDVLVARTRLELSA